MTDDELLAEMTELHGPDTARLVREIISGARGEPMPKGRTRAGETHTHAGRKGADVVVSTGRTLSQDPGHVTVEGAGRPAH